MGLLGSTGLLGSGICLSQQCKDDAASATNYKNALAAALPGLTAPTKDNTTTIIIIVAVIAVLGIVAGVFIITRKK